MQEIMSRTTLVQSRKLLDWTWENTPKGVKSVFDAFSGAATLSYIYKSKGLQVVSNDRLHYSHHIAKAIIENNYVRLCDNEIDLLLRPNAEAGTFIRDTFSGLYFGRGVHTLIDQYRANCDFLSGYKRDIALFALGMTCINSTCGFGNFTATSSSIRPLCMPNEFKVRFRDNLEYINSLVFDNGRRNKALKLDVNEALPLVKTDLVFFDVPYVTEFSVIDYEKAYHFVEGLMTYWRGKTIDEDTKAKYYVMRHEPLTTTNVYNFFQNLFENAGHYPYWVISYRDHAFPTEKEMRKIIKAYNRSYEVKYNEYHYTIAGKNTPASNSREFLFICRNKTGNFLNIPLPLPRSFVLPHPNRFMRKSK